jgi:hypothetical protein
MRHVSLLGQGGQQLGLAFFDSRRAFKRVLEAADAGSSAAPAHGVTFGAIDELPLADADAWQDHALPVAAPHAYPLPADLKRGVSTRRPDARALTFSEALLRALAETTEDELDAGTWRKRVQTFDGPIELTLTSRCEAARRPPTSPKHLPMRSRRPTAPWHGLRRRRGVLHPGPAASGEADRSPVGVARLCILQQNRFRCRSRGAQVRIDVPIVIHVKGFRTATPVGS